MTYKRGNERSYFLNSPQYNDFTSFIHSTNVYKATYVSGPVPGPGATVMDNTKSLLSWSLRFDEHNRCSINICYIVLEPNIFVLSTMYIIFV